PVGKSKYVYLVGSGDELDIEVWKEPDLSKKVTVSPDGNIELPIIGTISAADKPLQTVADAIATGLSSAIVAPSVRVTLLESHSARVQVMGEVNKQGPVAYHGRLSLVDAVQE